MDLLGEVMIQEFDFMEEDDDGNGNHFINKEDFMYVQCVTQPRL